MHLKLCESYEHPLCTVIAALASTITTPVEKQTKSSVLSMLFSDYGCANFADSS